VAAGCLKQIGSDPQLTCVFASGEMVPLQIRLVGKRTYSLSVTRKLQMENDAGRDAEIVLHFAVRCGFREARQKIFNLRATPRQTVKEFHINPAEGGGESVAGATCAEAAAPCVRDAKERLRERGWLHS